MNPLVPTQPRRLQVYYCDAGWFVGPAGLSVQWAAMARVSEFGTRAQADAFIASR